VKVEAFKVVKIQAEVFWAVILKMEALRSSRTLIPYSNTTQHHNPDDPQLEM
jgi:hypothetical protein